MRTSQRPNNREKFHQGVSGLTYQEAINLARQGRQEGFRFLYDQTYKSKYYLALQYMKNEQEVQDVLQEAYMKAFSKLDLLQQPEAFPSWLGMIVANTAKNMLKKKNPMLFSDLNGEDDEQPFEYEIEDENTEYQPELSYSRQETQQLVHEMIDALSEEQRICILMYEIEGLPIKHIAQALNCSENTVKSRLSYGRKKLKLKAEELQKRGYKLYGVAPVSLLLWLLYREQSYLFADGTLAWAQQQTAARLFAPQSSAAAAQTAAAGAKTGFFHTAAGKVISVAVAASVVAGGSFGAYQLFQHRGDSVQTETSFVVSDSSSDSSDSSFLSSSQPTSSEPDEVKMMQDEDYASLICGDLTKEEMALVLAWGPQEIPAQGFSQQDYNLFVNTICQKGEDSGIIQNEGRAENWKSQYSVEDVNRLFSSFTDYRFTEENDVDEGYGLDVRGDRLVFAPASVNYDASVNIQKGEYTEQEMILYFTLTYRNYDSGGQVTVTDRKATLKPLEDGKYRLVRIEDAEKTEE